MAKGQPKKTKDDEPVEPAERTCANPLCGHATTVDPCPFCGKPKGANP